MKLASIAALALPAAAIAATVVTAAIPLRANATPGHAAASQVTAGHTAASQVSAGHAAAGRPSSPFGLYDCANRPQVRPSRFDIACDGADALTNLKWTSWGSQAMATGVNWVNNCLPNCVGGKFSKQNVIVVLWRPEPVRGHKGRFGYSKMTLLYPGSGRIQDGVPPGAF